jgi:hypothetical protein
MSVADSSENRHRVMRFLIRSPHLDDNSRCDNSRLRGGHATVSSGTRRCLSHRLGRVHALAVYSKTKLYIEMCCMGVRRTRHYMWCCIEEKRGRHCPPIRSDLEFEIARVVALAWSQPHISFTIAVEERATIVITRTLDILITPQPTYLPNTLV